MLISQIGEEIYLRRDRFVNRVNASSVHIDIWKGVKEETAVYVQTLSTNNLLTLKENRRK